MSPKPTATSLALLSALQPDSTQVVQYSHRHMPRTRRIVQLRRGVLLVFKKSVTCANINKSGDTSDLHNADKALVLTTDLSIQSVGSTAVQIGKRERLWFASTAHRNTWLQLALDAQASTASSAARYEVQSQLGHGASGIVYLAKDRQDGRLYALKTVPKTEAFMSEGTLDSLVAERVALETAASHDSAFIVRLVDAFETDASFCFVTELGSFGDLRHIVDKLPGRKFPEEVARKLFAEIVLGLEDTHRMGYLYRDMKLGNLLLNADGHVRVADFGLAKRLAVQFEDSSVSGSSDTEEDDEESFRLVGRTKSFVGTRRYMSPEHLDRGYGAPSDIWAMGICLFVMLTGKHPLAQDVHPQNTNSLYHSIRNEEIVFPKSLSDEAVSMLSGLLNRFVGERFDFAEIKSHPWMKGMNWSQLKRDSLNQVAQEDVLSVLRDAGIQQVESKPDASGMKGKVPAVLAVTDQQDRKLSRKGSFLELLGFGHMQKIERGSFSSDISSVSSPHRQ